MSTTCCPVCASPRLRPRGELQRIYDGVNYRLTLARCIVCGFVFQLDPPPIEYNEVYLHLEAVVPPEQILSQMRARERVASIARWVPPDGERSFLDIGLGDGLLLSQAEQVCYRTFGFDVNLAGVELARRQYGLRAEIHCGPELQAAFPGHRFDVIHMNEVIEHIAEPMPLLRWCREHLASGGRLVIQTGNLDSLASRLKGAQWDYFRPVHVSYFSARTLTAALARAGFQVTWRATADWRAGQALRAAAALLRTAGGRPAARFVLLYVTALPFGFRRSMLFHAT